MLSLEMTGTYLDGAVVESDQEAPLVGVERHGRDFALVGRA